MCVAATSRQHAVSERDPKSINIGKITFRQEVPFGVRSQAADISSLLCKAKGKNRCEVYNVRARFIYIREFSLGTSTFYS